jgi:hypothetical protein
MSTGNNKFSRQLQTSKRTRLTEQRVTVNELGAWNPDATDASRNEHDFAEVRNMRKMRPNELETRSGYKQWRFEGWPAVPPVPDGAPGRAAIQPPFTVLARAEYRLNDVFVDVTLFSASDHQLHALIVQPSQEQGGGSAQAVLDVANAAFSQVVTICACGAKPIATAKQFGDVSYRQYDRARSERSIGLRTLRTGTGDRRHDLTVSLERTAARQIGLALPIRMHVSVNDQQDRFSRFNCASIPCGRSSLSTKDRSCDERAGDAAAPDRRKVFFCRGTGRDLCRYRNFGAMAKQTRRHRINRRASTNLHEHTKSRGWMYRVVLKRKFKDARNQEHIEVEAPSPDFYVEDRIYSPAGIGYNTRVTG